MSQLHVSSVDRSAHSKSETDFVVKLTGQFRGIKSVRLVSAEVPNSFYLFDATNNQLVITQGSTTIFTVPPGTYSATSLATVLNGLITPTYANISVVFDGATLKFTISDSISTVFSINAGSTIASDMGFPIVPLAGLFSYTGANSADFLRSKGGQYLYIQSHRLSSVQMAPVSANDYSSCIFKIPILTGYGSVIDYNQGQPQEYTYGNVAKNIDEIDIRLTYANGQIVNNNGVDISFTLGLEFE